MYHFLKLCRLTGSYITPFDTEYPIVVHSCIVNVWGFKFSPLIFYIVIVFLVWKDYYISVKVYYRFLTFFYCTFLCAIIIKICAIYIAQLAIYYLEKLRVIKFLNFFYRFSRAYCWYKFTI